MKINKRITFENNRKKILLQAVVFANYWIAIERLLNNNQELLFHHFYYQGSPVIRYLYKVHATRQGADIDQYCFS